MGCKCLLAVGVVLLLMGVIGALPDATLKGVTDLVTLPLWYAGLEILIGLAVVWCSMKNECKCCK